MRYIQYILLRVVHTYKDPLVSMYVFTVCKEINTHVRTIAFICMFIVGLHSAVLVSFVAPVGTPTFK